MADQLSEELLNAIRERCNKATKGPWISFIEGRDHSSGESVIVRGEDGSEDDLYLIGATNDDQDFIAHARQDVPMLLDEIKRLKERMSTTK